MIAIAVRLPLAAFTLDVDVRLDARVTALFGPSGAGKTSLLECVAGLRTPERGRIAIGPRVVFSSVDGVNQRPEHRRIGYVPQDVLLFPHLDARRNILYGVRKRREPLDLSSVVAALRLGGLLDRRPALLSGGERQRVALARALVTRPDLLLLDEPLAALDVGLKDRVLPYLRSVCAAFQIPAVFVTHDVRDALAFCDEVVVLERGVVVNMGPPADLLPTRQGHGLQPLFGTRFENVLIGTIAEHEAEEGMSGIRTASGALLWIPLQPDPPGEVVRVGVLAEDILVSRETPSGISARNVLDGRIDAIEESTGVVMLRVLVPDPLFVRVTRGAVRQLQLAVGSRVALIIKAHSMHRLERGEDGG